jgi:hypothetical protein
MILLIMVNPLMYHAHSINLRFTGRRSSTGKALGSNPTDQLNGWMEKPGGSNS